MRQASNVILNHEGTEVTVSFKNGDHDEVYTFGSMIEIPKDLPMSADTFAIASLALNLIAIHSRLALLEAAFKAMKDK